LKLLWQNNARKLSQVTTMPVLSQKSTLQRHDAYPLLGSPWGSMTNGAMRNVQTTTSNRFKGSDNGGEIGSEKTSNAKVSY
jgi:hypothetical protein